MIESSTRVVVSNCVSVTVGGGFSKVRLCISSGMCNNWSMVDNWSMSNSNWMCNRMGNSNWMSNSYWVSNCVAKAMTDKARGSRCGCKES